MPKTPKGVRVRKQRAYQSNNIKKLQKAGLIPASVNPAKKPDKRTIETISKYRAVLTGKATALTVSDAKAARQLRKKLGLKGRGKTVVIPKEKGERYRFAKTTGEIVSTRPGYNKGETIHKTLGSQFPAAPEPGSGKRLYYTIPSRVRGRHKLKRQTFSSFDEFLYYISKYEIEFEDIEDRIETEEVVAGGRKDRRIQKSIHDERARAVKRKAQKSRRKRRTSKRR